MIINSSTRGVYLNYFLICTIVAMTWNYKIIHHDTEERPYFAIHEVLYDERGEIANWTTDPISVTGESQTETLLEPQLKKLTEDID